MAHDFAKRRSSRSSRRRKSSRRRAKGPGTWGSFFTGLVTGIFASGIIYLSVLEPRTNEELVQMNEVSLPPALENPAATAFDFYESLRNAEVTVDVEPVELRPIEVADPNKYRLQAGSFQSRTDAETRRAELILLGMNAEVVPGVVSGRTWYRVQIGPFEGRNNADTARNSLSLKNIDTIVLLAR